MQQFHIIGITDNRELELTKEVKEIIANGRVFSGGIRHREIVSGLLPQDSIWIDITVPIDDVFKQYEWHKSIVVFASGDPLFFGFANTVMRKLSNAIVKIYPTFNSLQLLAHKTLMPYHDMHTISLTGRPWKALDIALIEGRQIIGSLTDREKTPNIIAKRMLEYGYDNYEMTIGECLGNENEKITTTTLIDASILAFKQPNCIILKKKKEREKHFGIGEDRFELLNGRVNMITKMPIRLLTLNMLELNNKKTLWDIGFCTGSVSIEAKLQFPHLDIFSFEKRSEGEELIIANSRKFGALGITHFIDDFTEVDTNTIKKPDAVFIGGHGGKMEEIVKKVSEVIERNGTLVFNSVSENSRQMFEESTNKFGFRIEKRTNIAIDNHNPIEIIKAVKL